MNEKITSRDVARAAGVSQSLVSLILNNVPDKKIKSETRELVIDTAKKLNYRVNVNARSMKNKRAGAVGLLSAWETNSFVFPPVISGIQSVCSQNDIGVLVCTGKIGPSGNEDYIDYFLQNRIDGLIYVSYVGVGYDGIIKTLTEHGIPFVCVIGARDLDEVSCVDVSFVESGYMAGKHLVDQGFSNIAYSCGNDPNILIYAEKERFEGCKKALEEAGKKIDPVMILKNISEEEDCLKIGRTFLQSNKYDAIISTSYECFILLKAAALEGIKVPNELGIISLDNELYAPYVYPSLTTIDEPLIDIAKRATMILLEKVGGNKKCYKIELSPLISARESTCK